MHQTQHFVAGILFFVVGLVFLVSGWAYPLGSMSRMGAGMFPHLLSIGLMVCAAVLILQSWRLATFSHLRWSRIGRDVRISAVIFASIVVYGLLIERAGIVVSVMALCLISFLAGESRSVLSALLGASLLAAGIAAIFVGVLNIPLKVFP